MILFDILFADKEICYIFVRIKSEVMNLSANIISIILLLWVRLE